MADSTKDDDSSIQVRSRGQKNEETNSQPNNQQEIQQPNQNPAPQQQEGSSWKGVILRMVIFWVVLNFFRSKSSPPQNATSGDGKSVPLDTGPCSNIFKNGERIDLYVYLSENSYQRNLSSTKDLIWKESGIEYGNWDSGENKDGSIEFHHKVTASENVMQNGSLYLHVFAIRDGFSADPESQSYNPQAFVNQSRMMTIYRKKRIQKTKNLLTGPTNSEVVNINSNKTEIISYWHPNLTLNLVYDQTMWPRGSLPVPLNQYIMFDNHTNVYYPVLYLNDYWNYAADNMPINDTTPILDLHLTFSPLSLFKWQMYVSQKMRSQWNEYLGDTMQHTDEEEDMLKRTLRETNPYLLGLTMVVSLVHSVFEFLAFKNDIQFWRSRKSLEGLSVRSVFFNVFQSLIVVLYVLDNETNMVVVVSCCVGLVIELWKITKVVDIKLDVENRWGPFPSIRMQDKSSYQESPTKKFDMLAFKYLSWLLFPLLGCYSIYSLIYNEHKGWYSFVLSIMYGFLLTFGFIMMTPQLFINYKMKSVAHLPWRMLTYKALNTFIDDIFAFVIKMPTLYRIGCLRDDIIFFIFLYQKWIYPVDHKRLNEFGTSGEIEEKIRQGINPAEETSEVVSNGHPAITEEKVEEDKKNV
ncbi:putative lipid scramblase CLPTM1 [Rhopilema esculentum]|uniref:putative lipid scramblase CLPTM1 n=1 Tax=Rhopilema esculentum TaxID=499914 RepID=UPI0031DC7111